MAVNREVNPNDETVAKEMFINCAGWLLNRIIDRGTHLLWLYGYQMSYDTNEGWGSTHAQIVGITITNRSL